MTLLLHPAASVLPRQQKAVLAFIDAELASGRPVPSFAAIREHMGWKCQNSAVDCVNRLMWRGLLRWTFNGQKRTGIERIV